MIIYKTTNLVNSKIYIGKDTKADPNYFGSGTYLRNAIKKYGKENFKKEILETCDTNEKLCEQEIYWIAKLDSRNPSVGYNILPGGEGWNSESAKIAGLIGNKNRTPEERSKTISSVWAKLSPEQKSEKAKLIWKNKTKEEHSEVARKNWEQFTKQERSDIANLRWKSMSKELKAQISESIKRSWENNPEKKLKFANILNEIKKKLSPEQRSEIARKAVAGRWKKLAAKKLAESENKQNI